MVWIPLVRDYNMRAEYKRAGATDNGREKKGPSAPSQAPPNVVRGAGYDKAKANAEDDRGVGQAAIVLR